MDNVTLHLWRNVSLSCIYLLALLCCVIIFIYHKKTIRASLAICVSALCLLKIVISSYSAYVWYQIRSTPSNSIFLLDRIVRANYGDTVISYVIIFFIIFLLYRGIRRKKDRTGSGDPS